MIACYVWTDIQLIHAVNAKISVYAKQQAALFVMMLDRISPSLVDAVESEGMFQRVVRIPPPPDFRNKAAWNRRLRLLFYGGKYKRYFNGYAQGQTYDLFLTGGYWSYALFLLRCFHKNNPSIRVAILEEGIGSYYRTRARFCQIWPRTCFAERMMRRIYFGCFAGIAARKIDSIVVYKPHLVRGAGMEPIKMPPLTAHLDVYRQIFATWNVDRRYTQAQAYMFAMPGNMERLKKPEAQVWAILQRYFPSALLLEHPDRPGAPGMPFEIMCAQMDLSARLLLGFSSSGMLYPNYCFLQEPYVLFTHWVYGRSSGLAVEEAQAYAEDLRSCYQHPDKVLVPRSMFELESILQKLQEKQVKTI